jgi:hypothetical protein
MGGRLTVYHQGVCGCRLPGGEQHQHPEQQPQSQTVGAALAATEDTSLHAEFPTARGVHSAIIRSQAPPRKSVIYQFAWRLPQSGSNAGTMRTWRVWK